MTSSTVALKGSIVALVTPMHEDGSVDYPSLRKLIDWHVAEGTNCIGVVGTTGESPTVNVEEHCEIIRVSVEQAAGRVPVMAGCGANSTHEAIELAKFAKSVGADSQLQVVPYYNKPTQEGQYQHFKAIAEAVDLPVLLYNIPGRCAINMTAETTLRLAHDVPNIVGIKEASGIMEQVKAIIDGAPEDFVVYSGDDSATLEIMKMGGVGVVSTVGNVAPARMKEIVELAAAGKMEEAEAANERLLPLMEGLFATTNPILVKEALKLEGFPVGGVRLPLIDATPEQSVELERIMTQVGVL